MGDELLAIQNGSGELVHADQGTFPLYSITKTYIAVSIVAMGIDIERPIADWIDASWVERGRDIKVRHLLNHTSGLRDYGALDEYAKAVTGGGPAWSDSEFADRTIRLPLLFEPGNGWAYSNPGYWLLGQIAQRESGLSFSELLNRHVIDPLDLTDTSIATGQFADDLPDYPAEWVWHGLLIGSPVDTVKFMSSALIDPLRAMPVPVPFQHPQWNAPHYGLGLMTEPGQRFGHNGGGPGYSAACYHFEETGVTACLLLRSRSEDAAMSHLLSIVAE